MRSISEKRRPPNRCAFFKGTDWQHMVLASASDFLRELNNKGFVLNITNVKCSDSDNCIAACDKLHITGSLRSNPR
ncbi:hypothetical protein GWI33_014091 [Rhynchophorus ferrugineus]|uniref:Uncharacterized protein n=1 Tax=Rhynchophorus ferrugineus TaxID=354439 RepID=A0A834I2E7_RHYFE|nr:hypothetical protein GWI33_014091 [Rhynchophorus ferrugineus]